MIGAYTAFLGVKIRSSELAKGVSGKACACLTKVPQLLPHFRCVSSCALCGKHDFIFKEVILFFGYLAKILLPRAVLEIVSYFTILSARKTSFGRFLLDQSDHDVNALYFVFFIIYRGVTKLVSLVSAQTHVVAPPTACFYVF